MAVGLEHIINLAADEFPTGPMEVPRGASRASFNINFDSTLGFGTAVVEVEWSVDLKDGSWSRFSPTISMNSTTTSRQNVPVSGCRYIRLITTTADGSADANAGVLARFE